MAISQAGAFICWDSSLSEYRELYRQERDSLLEHKEDQDSDPYKHTVYATWRLSYEKLKPEAKLLLQMCSFLHHEGISEDIFQKAALSDERLTNEDLQNEATRILSGLGKDGLEWKKLKFLNIVKNLS